MILNTILLALGFVIVLGAILKLLPKSQEQRFDALYRKFTQDRRGMSFADQQHEFALRSAAARLRRRASEAVLQRPQDHDAIIGEIIKDEAMVLASRDKGLGRSFVNWTGSMSLTDILYPEAFQATVAWAKAANAKPRRRINLRDSIAALNVLE